MLDRQRIIIFVAVVSLLVAGFAPAAGAQTDEYQHEEAERVENDEMDDGVWSDVTFRHSASVTTHAVEVRGDYAYIAISSREGGENVVFTDSTRQTTGEAERQTAELESGQQVYRVPLENPSVKAITVDSEGRMLVWIGEKEDDSLPLNLNPYLIPVAAVILGFGLGVIILVGLEMFSRLHGGNTEVIR